MLVIPCDTYQLKNFMDMRSAVPEFLQMARHDKLTGALLTTSPYEREMKEPHTALHYAVRDTVPSLLYSLTYRLN